MQSEFNTYNKMAPVIPQFCYQCLELPPFSTARLEELRGVFQPLQPCALRQGWLPHEEAGFTPAVVRAGWRADSLLVFAEMSDSDVFNDANELDLRLWELGDVFEIFLGPCGQSAYMEFQITPHNRRLQLRYPDASGVEEVRRGGRLESFLAREPGLCSAVWLRPTEQKWFVLTQIHSSLVCEKPGSLANNQWRFSFCRYDYTRGSAGPVISSTSAYSQPDFHRLQEWGTLLFVPSPQEKK